MILPSEPRAFLGPDAISFSEAATLARCEQAWVYSYTGTREKSQSSKAMQLGSDTHEMWGRWHMDHEFHSDEPETDIAYWLMDRYSEYYTGDGLVCLGVEWPVVAKLPWFGAPYFFGFADALMMYRREIWLTELKTTATLSNVEYLARTLQMPLYVAALREMGIPVAGAMLDVIRNHKPVRKELPLEESFARRWLRDPELQIPRALAQARRACIVRTDLLPGRHGGDPDQPLRNVGSSCSWCSHQPECFDLCVEVLEES